MFVKKIMKTTINLFTSIALLLAITTSIAQNRVSIDNETSTLNWTGKKVLGEHTGTIKLANSYIVLDEKGVKNGEINMQRTSLTNTDMEGEWSDKLVEHLKIKNTESMMVISGLAEVDRTLYDVKYGSASFFDSLGDKAINNLFELNFELKVKRK